MSRNESLETGIAAIADLIRKIAQAEYERGREDGKQDALQRVLQAVQPISAPSQMDPRTVFGSVNIPPPPPIGNFPHRTPKRAPWGLVPKLILEVAAENAGATMLTEQIAPLVKGKSEHDIADSSIRSSLSELALKGSIMRLGRSEWRFPEKQEAPQAEPDGASADEIREREADIFG